LNPPRHPDKHPDNQEEAIQKFQVIQRAFESLMSTDEEEVQAQIAG
jgi:curved DNA-binding protein CbpA